MSDRITIRLIGGDDAGGDVDFGDFRGYCAGLSACLRATELVVAPHSGKIAYRIVDLEHRSAGLTLEAVPPPKEPDRGGRVVALFHSTVDAIQQGRDVDSRFNLDDLRLFRRLAEPVGSRLKEAWVGGTNITSEFLANLDRLLNEVAIPTHGRVSGRLERVNVHDRFEFVLYPPIEGYAVVCNFSQDLLAVVKEAIQSHVTVEGKLFYRGDRPFPDRAQVTDVVIHPEDASLPSLADLRGMSPGGIDGFTSVDFVRALRDD